MAIRCRRLLLFRIVESESLFYSVGWNEKDDGGLIVLRESGTVVQDDGDWVWQYTNPNTRIADKNYRISNN